jgi:hypothetical protein
MHGKFLFVRRGPGYLQGFSYGHKYLPKLIGANAGKTCAQPMQFLIIEAVAFGSTKTAQSVGGITVRKQ